MQLRTLALLIIFATATTCFNACKSDNTTQESTEASDVNPNLAANMSWTFLTHKVFHNRRTVNAAGPSEQSPNAGHWIDFNENGTYTYGIWDEQTYSGTWSYDDDTKLLDLVPSNNTKPSQWKVMHKDDNLILVGTSRHNDNAIQQQWVRRDGRPSKTPGQTDPQ